MIFHLSDTDQELLKIYIDAIPERWRRQVELQIKSATVTREITDSAYFVFFKADYAVHPVKMSRQVPVEVIFDEVSSEGKNYPPMIHPEKITILDPNAFAIRLHFYNGYVSEMEVYCLSGNKLNLKDFNLRRRIYLYYE